MNEEEIKSRILVCEIREREYREVGNVKTADRYSQEKYKWEALLDKLNPKRDEELEQFKKGYYRLEGKINEIKECINKQKYLSRLQDMPEFTYAGSNDGLDKALQIIDKYLGESNEGNKWKKN